MSYGSIKENDARAPLLTNNDDDDDDEPAELAETHKRIGFIGSVAIFLNAIVGPGITVLPSVFNISGSIIPIVTIIGGSVLGALATIVRCDVVALMPGNKEFTRSVEFCDPVKKHMGPISWAVAHVLFFLTAFTLCVASISLTANTVDLALAYVFGRSFAVTVYRGRYVAHTTILQAWKLTECEMGEVCRPFFTGGDVKGSIFVTLGYVMTMVLLLPLCTLPVISEGMMLQYISFAITLTSVAVFVVAGAIRVPGQHSGMPYFTADQHNVPGIVIFNLMYGVFVSTWLCEKRPEVYVRAVVGSTAAISGAMYVFFGLFVGWGFNHVSSNAILSLAQRGMPDTIVLFALCFGIVVIASGIPVAAVMARQNLESIPRLKGTWTPVFMCGILPWCVAFFCYPPHIAAALMSISGLYVISWLALILPFLLILAVFDPLPVKPSFSGYFQWFMGHLQAAPDDNLPTVVFPLPIALQKHARPIYAAVLGLMVFWILFAMCISLASAAGV